MGQSCPVLPDWETKCTFTITVVRFRPQSFLGPGAAKERMLEAEPVLSTAHATKSWEKDGTVQTERAKTILVKELSGKDWTGEAAVKANDGMGRKRGWKQIPPKFWRRMHVWDALPPNTMSGDPLCRLIGARWPRVNASAHGCMFAGAAKMTGVRSGSWLHCIES